MQKQNSETRLNLSKRAQSSKTDKNILSEIEIIEEQDEIIMAKK